MWSEAKTQIGTLKVRGAQRDDPALRLAISSQLGGAEFNPPGMPPAAVLIVRSMADPLPGRLSIRGGVARPCAEWERAAQGRMSELYRRAARPQQGRLAGDANAVVFTDEAELLACLMLDLSRGVARQHWWWRLFLKSLSASPSISPSLDRLMSAKAMYVPAILDHLAQWGHVKTVLQALSPQDAVEVLSTMAEVYQLTEIKAGLAPKGKPSPVTSDDKKKPLHRQGARGRASKRSPAEYVVDVEEGLEHDMTGIWHRWLGTAAVPKGLTKEQTYVLGLGLMLHRIPSLARSADLQRLVVDWWKRGDTHRTERTLVPIADSDAAIAAGEVETFLNDDKTQAKPEDLLPTSRYKEKPDQAPKIIQDSVRVESFSESTRAVHPEALQTQQPQQSITAHKKEKFPTSGAENPEVFPAAKAVQEEALSESVSEDQEVSTDTEDFVSTRIGGVLYVINLMLQLDLPHCFEKDWHLASQLGTWGLLELLGRALLEDARAFDDDPLWTALAVLDGRKPGELPGKHFSGNDVFKIPAPWFQQVRNDRENFRWAAMRRRLRLWSSAGYVMVEIPRDKRAPHLQAETELQGYVKGGKQKYPLSRSPFAQAPIDSPEQFKTSGLNKDLSRWLELTLPYIRYRLKLLFETEPVRHAHIAKQLCVCPGRLYVTSTHVDFVTDMDNISIPIRKAGLDRNPGWLADFGRVVQFHFE